MTDAGWYRDPSGANDYRYFDGQHWTNDVSSGGQQSRDMTNLAALPPPIPSPPQPPPPSVPATGQWQPQPTAQTTAPTNGLAVAALVLGIIGTFLGFVPFFFFLSLPLGFLALIFGLIGLRNVRRGAAKKGMSIAGGLLGVVAMFLGVVGVIAIDRAVDQFGEDMDEAISDLEDTYGPASADEYDAKITRCGRDDLGFLEAEGTVTNRSSETMDFSIIVYFKDSGDVRVAEASDYVSTLTAGSTARWTASSFQDPEGAFTCEVFVK